MAESAARWGRSCAAPNEQLRPIVNGRAWRIDAAVDERVDLLAVDRLHLIEINLAERGVVDVGRERQRLVRRPERSGDPARLAIVPCIAVGDFANDLGRRAVDL